MRDQFGNDGHRFSRHASRKHRFVLFLARLVTLATCKTRVFAMTLRRHSGRCKKTPSSCCQQAGSEKRRFSVSTQHTISTASPWRISECGYLHVVLAYCDRRTGSFRNKTRRFSKTIEIRLGFAKLTLPLAVFD